MAAPRESAGRIQAQNPKILTPHQQHMTACKLMLISLRGGPMALCQTPRQSSLAACLTRVAAMQGGQRQRRR